MIKELLLATIVSTSLSVRTPNDVEKKLDYEFSVKIENTNEKFRYLLKRDWERELGEKYIDDVFKFSHTVNNFIYYGVKQVLEKSSDGLTTSGFEKLDKNTLMMLTDSGNIKVDALDPNALAVLEKHKENILRSLAAGLDR